MKLKNRTITCSLAGLVAAVLVAALPARAQYSTTVLSQGPVGYWRLNETVVPGVTSPAANLGSLGSSANGTYDNSPVSGLTGPFAGSLAIGLDGSSSDVQTPWQAGLNTKPFSVELWVNPAVVPEPNSVAYVAANAQITSPRTGWYLAQDSGVTFGAGSAFVVRLFYNNTTTPLVQLAAPVTTVGVWYHLVLTHDGTTASFYCNGALVTNAPAAAYVPNAGIVAAQTFFLGKRSDGGYPWAGQMAEVATYPSALTAVQVANHYTTATSNPGNYQATVLGDSPTLYWRFRELNSPPAVNIGSRGSAANGLYAYDSVPGVAGPQLSEFPGFEPANKAVSFTGSGLGGMARLPALNLNTNTVSMTCWVKPNGSQQGLAGIAIAHGGSTLGTGLAIDDTAGLGVAIHWGGNGLAHNGPSGCSLVDGDWSYVALSATGTNASLYVANSAAGWQTFVDNFTPAVQAFDTPITLGADTGAASGSQYVFKGVVDEFAIWNRTLREGEIYTQYGSAVGGLAPQTFPYDAAGDDLQGPATAVAVGDPFVLTIDAGGTPALGYNWYNGSTYVTTTTNGVLTIASAVLTDAGTYSVTVTNAFGTAYSLPVVVHVILPSAPSILATNGFVNRTLYTGGTLNMSVVAIGGGLKYQWNKGGSPISGATLSGFTIASVTTNSAGSYSVIITNLLGSTSAGPAVLTVPSVATNSYEALIIASAPEGWWRLGEPAGSTNLWDAMGRHDGFYTNLASTVPPILLGVLGVLANDPDTAATISPTTKGIGVVPYSPNLNPQQFTVEGWVKTTVANGSLAPFSCNDAANGWWWETINGYWCGFVPPNTYAPDYSYGLPSQITAGQWTHLALTFDWTRVNAAGSHFPFQYFVNGVGDAGYIWGGPTPTTSAPFIIGGHGTATAAIADAFFNGQVDEVAVYRRVVPQTELATHFQGRFGATTPPYFVSSFVPQTTVTGKNITYTTTVYGSLPIALQWFKNGSPISGATTTTLAFTNTAVTNTGFYTLRATNNAGTAVQSVALTIVPPAHYANVTNSLVLHLKFEGDTMDSSGRSNNGTPSAPPAPGAAPAFVQGIIGAQALQYTTLTVTNTGVSTNVSSASYVDLGDPPDLQFGAGVSFTVGLWVKVPSGDLQGDLPYIGNATNSNNNLGWDLSPSYKTGDWQFCLNDGTVKVGASGPGNGLNDGNWHNFVVTVDRAASVANAYLDSILVSSMGISQLGSVENGGHIIIGQDPKFAYVEPGGATLDDIGIWRRALSPAEVTQIYGAATTSARSFDTVAPVVTLTVTQTGTSVTLGWSTGTLLQSPTLDPTAVWTPVPGASAPSYTFTPSATGSMYYRVLVQ